MLRATKCFGVWLGYRTFEYVCVISNEVNVETDTVLLSHLLFNFVGNIYYNSRCQVVAIK